MWLLALGWIIGCFFGESVEASEPALKQEVLRLNKRYEDFFKLQELRKRDRLRINPTAAEQKKLRLEYKLKRDRARKKYILLRPPEKLDDYEAKILAERKKKQSKKRAQRSQFLLNRNRLRQMKKAIRKVPEMKEVGLE